MTKRVTLARHTGSLKDEVIEIEIEMSLRDFRNFTDNVIIKVRGVYYMRDGRDRSVYFDIKIPDLTLALEIAGIK